MPPQRPRVLVIDADPDVQTTVGTLALAAGFEVATTVKRSEAVDQVRQRPAQLALVDARRPDIQDVELVRVIRSVNPGCQVALMVTNLAPARVVEAIAGGAVDCLTKPLDVERVRALLGTVREEYAFRREMLALEADVAQRLEFCGMVGRGPAMQGVFDLIRRLAPHVRLALVSGEDGTGKGLVARALHTLGPRHLRPFVALNCAAVVDSLLERELFGCAKDAFADAPDPHPGVFEIVNGGTIFLHDIADLSAALQLKLLHAIDTGEIQRLGERTSRPVDVRVIGATARELRRDVAAGRFNRALYERLAAAEIRLPAIRERVEDLPYLTASFVRNFATRFERPVAGLTVGAERLLLEASWTGNVRQLRSVLERACILAESEFITEAELAALMAAEQTIAVGARPGVTREARQPRHAATPLTAIERQHIVRTLDQVGGNKATAARMLGVSRRALYRQLERHGLHTRMAARSRQTATESMECQ